MMIKEKIIRAYNWCKERIVKCCVALGVIGVAMAATLLPEQIPEHLRLKAPKEDIVYSQEYTETKRDTEGKIISEVQMITYGYKSGELAPALDNEIISQRTPHIVYRNLGGMERSAQSGYNFYKDGKDWKKLKYHKTTKDAFEKQTISILDSFIAWATDTAATSPGTMADDAAVGTLTWSNPDNSKLDNNTYSAFQVGMSGVPTDSHYLKATNFGFAVSGTVNGIYVQWQTLDIGGGATCVDNEVKIVKADASIGTENKAVGGNWPDQVDVYVNYGANNDLWSESWTAGNINDSDFGAVLSGTINGNFSACQNDHIQITITYTAAAARRIIIIE